MTIVSPPSTKQVQFLHHMKVPPHLIAQIKTSKQASDIIEAAMAARNSCRNGVTAAAATTAACGSGAGPSQ